MSTEPVSDARHDDLPGQKIFYDSNVEPNDRRSITAKLDSGQFRSVHNFDGDKMQVWKLSSKACGPDCKQFKDIPDVGIDLHYFYCHRVEMVSSRDGEIVEPIRVVLIDKDGTCYGFVSDFLVRELDTLIETWGNGPWYEPLKIRVVSAQSRKGNRFYSIQPA